MDKINAAASSALTFVKSHWKIVVIIVVAIVLLIVVTSIGGKGCTGCTGCTTGCTNVISSNVTIDGSGIKTYNNDSAARNNPSATIEGTALLSIVDGSENVAVQATGTSSNVKSAAATDGLKNLIGKITGSSGIKYQHGNGTTFKVDANSWNEGETVLVEITIASGDFIKDRFADGDKTVYFAFIAKHGADNTPEQSGSQENQPQPTDQIDPDQGNTNQGESNQGTEQVNPTQAPTQSSSKIIVENVTCSLFDSWESACDNYVNLPNMIASNFNITAVPGEGISNINIWVDGASGGQVYKQELFLCYEHWTESLNLSAYAGQTVIVCICSQTDSLIPKCTYQYIAFKVPSGTGSINYVDPTPTPEPAAND